MGKIYYLIGKSSTGKDTIYKRLMKESSLDFKSVVMYTTRPMRDGEENGKTYHFVTEDEYLKLKSDGKIIEERAYNTVHGIWRYFIVLDGQIDMDSPVNYLMLGVLQSYINTRDYFGNDKVLPIYIEVDDGVRLQRALDREKKPENRKFTELCRRFLADSEDFSEDKLMAAGIEKRFINDDLDECVAEIVGYIEKCGQNGY